ncbi:Transcriptional regulator modE [Leminorella richardii]|uniref:Transcriptional regulator modE n=1 Tax=Leminorella richardii TaxID=158841 RepID=A0A2X4UIF2_9GAMM|nr:TOBE domain-containing protein [Leminorella richardii]SQI34302.1 Transcriptional regulator modE [Leminorella richardii]
MKVSARNQLAGTVSSIIEGAVNDEVVLALDNGENLVTVVTKSSAKTLGISVGKKAIAIIKAPWVVLANPDCGLNFSARNQFAGRIVALVTGAVNSTVTVKTDKGLYLTAVITNDSVDEMPLKEGDSVLALVKASSVILATEK